MTRLQVFAVAVAVAALAAVLATLLFAPLVADAILTGALRAQGFKNPSLEIASVSPQAIVIRDLKAGADPAAPDLAFARLEAHFDPVELLARRRIRDLRSRGDAALRLRLVEGGGVEIAGYQWRPGGGGGSGGAPLDSLAVERLAYGIIAPAGEFRGSVAGAVDRRQGGQLTADLGGAARIGAAAADALRLELAAELRADGAMKFIARGTADLSGSGVSFPGTALEAFAEGSGWRALFGQAPGGAALAADLDVIAPPAPAAANPLIAGFLAPAPEGGERMVSAEARLRLRWADRVLSLALTEDGARISDGAGAVRFEGLGNDPLFIRDADGRRLALSARISGADVGGTAHLRASAAPGARWKFLADGAFGDQRLKDYALGETAFAAEGEAGAEGLAADAVVSTVIRQAKVGRLAIADAPVVARAELHADFAAKTLAVSSRDYECVRIAAARLSLEGQASEARLGDAQFCRADGPLLVARWGDDPHADIRGRLTAATGSYRIGVTRFEGAPPMLDVVASYDPDAQRTAVDAEVSGGRIVINGAIVATEAEGAIAGRLEGEKLSGEARLDRVIFTQNVKTLMIAPVAAAGTVRLADDRAKFDYAAATLGGRALGTGTGAHDLKTGRGETVFASGELGFEPRGLQPSALILALRGIVGETVGRASAETTFKWGRLASDFRSSGAFALKDLSFVGPGRAVTRTVGVNGDVKLTNLSPLASDGVQTVTVGLVDLDALRLEKGEIRFSLPGDETLRVVEAEFPWFGGRIGAYDASAPLAGGDTRMDLKAENVDLGEMLAFVDVEGLSGEGTVEGVLPLVVTDGRARIVDGRLSAKGPGVLRYQGKAAEAAAAANAQARLAFDLLRELHFDELSAKIDGPLDGALKFNVVFKGVNEVTAGGSRVASPVIYRISIEAPLLALLDQARVSTDFRLQFDRLEGAAGPDR